MADQVIVKEVAKSEIVFAQQSLMPLLITGEYVNDDVLYHSMIFRTAGKSRLTYGVNNLSDQDVVVTLYGSNAVDGEVGDAGVFLIPAALTASAASKGYQTTDDGFLYYIIRCKSAMAGNDKVVSIYAHLMPL